MCGFAGFLTLAPTPMDGPARHRTLCSMGDAIAHRGPDDAQYFDDGRLALVYRRLSIIDLEGGRQPFFNEDGTQLLAVNGEIYNHADLRHALAPMHRFTSHSDCEVVLHGLEQWGPDALERVEGMFALVHWDMRERRLMLARDRLGIKPLYICRLPHGLLFGSELKALLAHPDCPREIAWADLERQPIWQPTTATYVRGVEFLSGGEMLVVDAGGRAQQRSYWRLDDHLGVAPFGGNAARYSREYADLLEDVTHRHLQSDVHAAIYLSGGLDSSLLAGLVAKHDRNVPCLSVIERGSYLGGDADAAQRLTRRLGMPWHPVRFDYRHLVEDMPIDLTRLEQAVWTMDSPRIDVEWLFKDELHRVARSLSPRMKVILLGQGADEFAGGYSRRADAMYASWAEYLRDEVRGNLVYDAALAGDASTVLWPLMRDCAQSSKSAPYHRHMRLLCRQLQHHNLWHEDRTSSWRSLEARVPFLDHRLVELLASIPAELHETLFWDKRIVRDAFDRFVPGHALPQPKIGFLDSGDGTSQDIVRHDLLRAVAPEFRERYLDAGDSPFDARRVEALIERALARGPQGAVAQREAIQCIALAIFERQLRDAASRPASRDDRALLPIMTAEDWTTWSDVMPTPPKCTHSWRLNERVTLRPDTEILVSRGATSARFVFLRDQCVAGEITLLDPSGWAANFLRHLGTEATAAFTLQDWLDELDLPMRDLTAILDILFHQGVVHAMASAVMPSASTAVPPQRSAHEDQEPAVH